MQPHPSGPRLTTPTRPPPVLPIWPMEEQRMPRPAGAWQSPVAPGLDAWEDFVRRGGGERVLRPCQPPSSPGVTVPRRSQLAQEMWLVAASLWVSAAVFCLVTDALEMRFMTSSFLPTNRKRSRGEVFLPLRLCCFTRVSERRGWGKSRARWRA